MTKKNNRTGFRLQLLSGTVSEYSCVRRRANFVFTDNDRTSLGVVAIAASMAGVSGMAASTAASATAEEEADYLEFKLDGKQIKGWVWRSPFGNGDVVEVIAELQPDHFEAFAIARPLDRIVALYPHCSRGRIRHWLTVAKWWAIGSMITMFLTVLLCLVAWIFSLTTWNGTVAVIRLLFTGGAAILLPFFLIIAISTGWKWMSFVRLAEKVFAEFKWSNPKNIDLKSISKKTRTKTDTGEFGVFYFRY